MGSGPRLRSPLSLAIPLTGPRQEVATDTLSKPRGVLADGDRRICEAVAGVLSTKCEVAVVGCALDGARASRRRDSAPAEHSESRYQNASPGRHPGDSYAEEDRFSDHPSSIRRYSTV